ncbi:MAG: long-chain fatty acid--CoA ligase [Gammaproteobacteria bacterium AqS3]|nr:long-chain fatty acid--CoA ligase [Gammaproteobacteria bacterium AqS3]
MQHYDWSAHHAMRRPDEVAIVNSDSGQKLSYAQLDERARRLAVHLQGLGQGRGERIAMLSPNCPELFELEFACGKIGTVLLPLNWRLTVPELEFILNDSGAKVLIYDAGFAETAQALAERCESVAHTIRIDIEDAHSEYEQALAGADPAKLQGEKLQLEDLAGIMYTSGTTGHPKGAMITHQMNLINCVNLGTPVGISPETVQLVALPLFHTGGLNCYANPILHAGGRIVLMREFDPGRALAIIGDPDYGITHFFGVPAPYQFMMQHPDFAATDLSRLKVAGVGGAPCAEAILKTWQDRGVALVQGWGMTETSPGGTCLDAVDALRKIGSAGQALLHTEIKIVGDDGAELGADEVGELLIRGPNITPGYWNRPEATAEAFTEDGWLKTGDAARRDGEGFFYIVDRWKDMYISGGENVYPAEVENVLYQLPQVAEAAIIGVDDERWGEVGAAILVVKPGESLEESAILDHCLANLAKFKIPKYIYFTDVLPRNATGKVLKRTLREQFGPGVGADADAQ